MTIYIIIFIISFILAMAKVKYSKILLLISFYILAFIGIFRGDSVGTDVNIYTLNYIKTTFESSTWNTYTVFEPGFNYIIAIFKTFISNEPSVFIGVMFFVGIFCNYYFIYKTSYNPLLAIFFFVAFGYYMYSFNIMRQMLALGFISILVIDLYKNGKVIKFLIGTILISLNIHISLLSLCLLPFFYLIKKSKKIYNKKTFVFLVLLSYVLLLMRESWDISFLSTINLVDEKYTNYITYVTSEEVSLIASTLHTFFCIFVIAITPKVKNLFLFAYIFGIIFLNLLGGINPLFLRVSEMFLFFRIIVYTDLWYNIRNRKIKYLYRVSLTIYSIIIFNNILIKNYGEIVPYVNKLFS